MQPNRPQSLVVIAALQFIAVIVLPPRILAGMAPALWVAIAALFGVLGLGLYRQQAWARVASVFVQGMNIIVRLLTLLGNVVTPEGTTDVSLLVTTLVAGALSALILVQIDRPEIRMAVQ